MPGGNKGRRVGGEAEAALRRSEAELRAVLAGAPNIILRVRLDGTIEYANRVVEQLSADEVIGASIYDFLNDEDHDFVRGKLAQVIDRRETVTYEIAGHHQHVPGSWWSVAVGPIVVEGEVVGLIMTVIDATERRELDRRLAVSDRLASIGTLAAGVAHEINNPLAWLIGNLDVELREAAGVPERVQRLTLAREGAERIRRIVRELTSYSDSRDTEARPVVVAEAVESAVRMATSAIRYRASLVVDLGDVPMVLGDAPRLAQVFVNLLVNAAHAIPEDEAEEHEIRVSAETTADDRVVIEVMDSGRGIDAEDLERVFDPFFTTKSVGEGSGLGLYVCRGIVQALGGEITAESQVGRGAVFRVFLPIAGPGAKAVPTDEQTRQLPRAECRSHRVLVVDDEPALLTLIRSALDDCSVTTQTSAQAALDAVLSTDFDVILCDVSMPEFGGMELYQRIVKERPSLAMRMVFMTGGATTPRVQAFLDAIDNACLRKPFDFDELRTALDFAATLRVPANGERE